MFLQFVAETYFKVGAFLVAFHFYLLSGRGYFLLEDDGAVQQVVHLQFQAEVAVDVIAGAEVQCMQGLLFDVPQFGYAYRMDTAALQVVEQGEVQLPFFAEAEKRMLLASFTVYFRFRVGKRSFLSRLRRSAYQSPPSVA